MLAQEWTLSVRDFGPIKSADVTTAPLMVFAGRNNTGKSHLASLLWAISNPSSLFPSVLPGFQVSDECLSFIASQSDSAIISVPPAVAELLIGDLGRALALSKDTLARSVLSLESASIGNLDVAAPRRTRDFTYEMSVGQRLQEWVARKNNKPQKEITEGLALDIAQDLLCGNALTYISAARTGLVLTYRTIVASSIGSAFSAEQKDHASQLTAPTVSFLQQIATASPKRSSKFADIGQLIEREIAGGQIHATDDYVPGIFFQPEGRSDALPLHVTSSLVTEIAPFVVLLKTGALDNGFIFEEPEAHLHLDAQRALARALARLLNRGVPMILTTHSDTFLQQLNIQMWLHRHPKRDKLMAELGYQEDELINPEMIRGYHFEPQTDGTYVTEMDKRPQGLVVPSMNKTIRDLRKEIIALQKDDE